MESKNKMITLSVILVLLIVVYILGTVFSPGGSSGRAENKLLFEGISLEGVESVQLKGTENTIFLKKNENESWTIILDENQFPAETKKIEELISTLAELKKNKIVSSNSANWDRFSLGTGARAIVLRGRNDQAVMGLLVGDQGIRGDGDYIRREDEDTVFLSDMSVSFYLDKGNDYWSDLNLYPDEIINEDSISYISVTADIQFGSDGNERISANYSLVKIISEGQAQWIVQNSTLPLNQQLVNNLVRAFTTLHGDSFVSSPGNKDTGLINSRGETPGGEIHLTTSENRTILLQVGNQTENGGYYLKSSQSPYLYEISSWSLKRVVKNLNELTALK